MPYIWKILLLFDAMPYFVTFKVLFWSPYILFDVLTYFLTLWHTFWNHDELYLLLTAWCTVLFFISLYVLTAWCTVWSHVVIYVLTLWHVFWRDDVLSILFDVMAYFLAPPAEWQRSFSNGELSVVIIHHLSAVSTFHLKY